MLTSHGFLKTVRDHRGKRSLVCECWWQTPYRYRTTRHAQEQIQALREHVISTWRQQ